MLSESQFIQTLLPKHYYCVPKHNGVFCYTKDLNYVLSDLLWENFSRMVKIKYGSRLVEISHDENLDNNLIKNHTEFTVFLRP